jgi:hypothetical protein
MLRAPVFKPKNNKMRGSLLNIDSKASYHELILFFVKV